MLIIRSIIVLILLAMPAAALTGIARVVDGDTIMVGGDRLRLFGIDAPEASQRCDVSGRNWTCGAWATAQLSRLIGRAAVRCEARDTDRYGRTVAVCFANGRDLGAELVRAGAAVAFTRYSDRYLAEEALAKAQARGIWNGNSVPPGKYRRSADTGSSAKAPSGKGPDVRGTCQIKGNVSAKGLRIYHLPGQRDYAATRIAAGKGEALFCTEAEAIRAGFRKARR